MLSQKNALQICLALTAVVVALAIPLHTDAIVPEATSAKADAVVPEAELVATTTDSWEQYGSDYTKCSNLAVTDSGITRAACATKASAAGATYYSFRKVRRRSVEKCSYGTSCTLQTGTSNKWVAYKVATEAPTKSPTKAPTTAAPTPAPTTAAPTPAPTIDTSMCDCHRPAAIPGMSNTVIPVPCRLCSTHYTGVNIDSGAAIGDGCTFQCPIEMQCDDEWEEMQCDPQ
jgi:hypothetical protein